MTRIPKIVPHGSGPTTARGRAALWAELEPHVPAVCAASGIGKPLRIRRIDRGTHHLVWRVVTDRGSYALRPSTMRSPITRQSSSSRDRLWKAVGKWQVAPEYVGSVTIVTRSFSGRVEVFEWIEGRTLQASRDARAVAATLARLHSHPLSAVTNYLPVTPTVPFIQSELRRYSRMNRTGGSIEKILAAQTTRALHALANMRDLKMRSCLVHNDLVDGNVLYATGRIWLIDWDWALISAPCVDLYGFLSPFVRSWGSKPGFLGTRAAAGFLRAYFAEAGKGGRTRMLGAQSGLWHPYNTLLANWLYHEAKRLPHTGRSGFYATSFGHVSQLTDVIESFK